MYLVSVAQNPENGITNTITK